MRDATDADPSCPARPGMTRSLQTTSCSRLVHSTAPILLGTRHWRRLRTRPESRFIDRRCVTVQPCETALDGDHSAVSRRPQTYVAARAALIATCGDVAQNTFSRETPPPAVTDTASSGYRHRLQRLQTVSQRPLKASLGGRDGHLCLQGQGHSYGGRWLLETRTVYPQGLRPALCKFTEQRIVIGDNFAVK